MSTNEMSDTLQRAFQLYQAGDELGAENLLIDAAQSAQQQYGTASIEYASANYELGSMQHLLGRNDEAVLAFQRAIDVNIPDDLQATRDRMTYMVQLGEIYNQTQQFDEAERVLRQALELRREFYGVDHPGYAFGLEPLAWVVMNQGNFDEAQQLIDETIDNFWRNGHPRVATAFPLRAMILKRMNDHQPTFAGIEELPESILVEMVNSAIRLSESANAVDAQSMMDDLLSALEQRLAPTHDAMIRLLTGLVNTARSIGPSEGQIEMTERIIQAHLSNDDHPLAIDAQLGLAMMLSELGDASRCEATYKQAVAGAERIGDLVLQSQCLRNQGLFYAELGRRADAEATLRLAVQRGERAGDRVILGRALVALGIFLQHGGDLDDASQLLSQAMTLLPPSHPDGLCGRSHLNAIETNSSCGCGDMGEALTEAYRLHVLSKIPAGFVNDVSVQHGEDGFEVRLDFARELTDEESAMLQRALQQAHIDFQKNIKEIQ